MAEEILGWFIIAIGIISTISGVTGGIIIMLKDLDERPKSISPVSTEFIKALTDLLSALIKAPTWLALTVLGFMLIVWGGTLVN